MRLIVFSDLDGTLLDHHTYSYAPARPALERIRAEGWPLVLVTSKTRTEVERLRDRLRIAYPYVVENGGGIVYPEECGFLAPPSAWRESDLLIEALGLPYVRIRAFVEERGDRLGITGFGDMDDAEVSRLTGLSLPDAGEARARDFTEPFCLAPGASLDAVVQEAASYGISVTTGGRLHHLIGAEQDKGRAVERVRDVYAAHWEGRPITVSLGDGPNDLPMLYVADHPVVVPSPERPPLGLERDDARIAPAPGPEGWSAALLALFDELENTAGA